MNQSINSMNESINQSNQSMNQINDTRNRLLCVFFFWAEEFLELIFL